MKWNVSKRTLGLAIGLVYWLMITPTAFLLRLFGRGQFRLRDRDARTYWISRHG